MHDAGYKSATLVYIQRTSTRDSCFAEQPQPQPQSIVPSEIDVINMLPQVLAMSC